MTPTDRERLEALERENTVLRAERERLLAGEAVMRATVEALPFDFLYTDREGVALLQNSVCRRRWGNIVGKRRDEVAPDRETLAQWENADRRVLAGENFREEATFGPDREKRDFLVLKSPVRLGDQIIGVVGVNVDVTAQRRAVEEKTQAEARLRENRELFALLLRHTPVCTFVRSVVGGVSRVVAVSDSYARLVGLPAPQLLGRAVAELYPAALAGKITRQDVEVAAGTATVESDEEFRGRAYTTVKFPIPQADGSRLVAGFAIDVTERRRSAEMAAARLRLFERAVHGSLEELLQSTLDEAGALTGSPIGFYHFVEPDGVTLSLQAWSTRTVREFCTAAGQGLHYPVAEAGVWADALRERRPVVHNDYVSLPGRRGLPPGHAPVVRELVVPILRNDRVVAILGVGNRVDDYTQSDVELVRFFADVAWEIIEHKRAEASLQESAERYRRLVEAAPDILYTRDGDAGTAYYSPQVELLLGYTVDQLRENPALWSEAIHPDDRAAVDRARREHERRGRSEVEYRLRDAQGRWRRLLDRSVRVETREGDSPLVEGLVTVLPRRRPRKKEAPHSP